MNLMRFIAIVLAFALALNAATESAAGKLWAELKVKREKLASFHQEFEESHTTKTATTSLSSKRQIVLDVALEKWREKSISGSGHFIRIFDGSDLLQMEEGEGEFRRIKRRGKEQNPEPGPYSASELDLTRAAEKNRAPCGLPDMDHQCVLLEIPLKPWARPETNGRVNRMLHGVVRAALDLETGLLVSLSRVELVETPRGGRQLSTSYELRRANIGAATDATMFQLPSAVMREVKEFSRWSAEKIKKQLGSKLAPEFSLVDLQGNPVTLSAFKGKTVLLDFWTTWCPPCRADGPALDKLHRKYGGAELAIVGISVSEDREIVEKFLKDHPHGFPIVLTTENEMPRPYQISAFPTYIVIEKDGTLAAAVEGDQGFSELRKLLKKAGLEVD